MNTATLKMHGIREINRVQNDVDAIVEEIEINGYVVVESGYDEEKLAQLRTKIDAIYQTQITELGGEQNLKAINDANVARHLLAYDDEFLDLATHPVVDAVVSKLLGEFYVLMSQNALINMPSNDHYQTTWHRDLNYQHFVSSRPLAISILYCIDPFSEETGGTYILSGTHKIEKFPSEGFINKFQKVVAAPAGSIILFDAMLFHRAGSNSSNIIRRAVNHIFTAPFILQQISFPKMLGDRFNDNPRLRKMLGYESQIPDNVTAWRTSKLDKLKP
ncbi:MAG TPA: phytanoyl-CoA dioxygenase family protein [Flavipsychrobacter sp.]|nr:phytanoyl-CoA dioxygenase family protein [Flavipsychrobacter sp.]